MKSHLNLIKSEFSETEKRVFPRFPFTFLTFKASSSKDNQTFEVVDISYTGMQLSLKFGEHEFKEGQDVKGSVHWKGRELQIEGPVKWVRENKFGVAFKEDKALCENIKNFLSIDHVVDCMQPLHEQDLGVEMPSNLSYWLRADGPFEVFVWRHNDNELSKFQIITMEHFVEWEDGKGLKSGRVISKRDLDTPLFSEDEFVFQIDEEFDEEKLNFAQSIIKKVPTHYLTADVKEFLERKLGLA